MSYLAYLHQRYRKELECIERARCANARRAHQELARLYAIRIDMRAAMDCYRDGVGLGMQNTDMRPDRDGISGTDARSRCKLTP